MMKRITALLLLSCLVLAGDQPFTVALTPDEAQGLELAALREAVVAQEITLLKARMAELERERAKAGAEAVETFRLLCEAYGLDPDRTRIAGDFKSLTGR